LWHAHRTSLTLRDIWTLFGVPPSVLPSEKWQRAYVCGLSSGMLDRLLHRLRRLVVGQDVSDLGTDANALRTALKAIASDMARERAMRLRTATPTGPNRVGLTSKASTQRDIESEWFLYWCRELKMSPGYHRKLWEYAFVLQALHERGVLNAGSVGLGFACGSEPLSSYFASKGVAVTATDRSPLRAGDWVRTGQHATTLDVVFKNGLVERAIFDRFVRHEFVDMNHIPAHLDRQFDFCWSVCAMEHLGDIEHGLKFAENAMRVLKPGGVAVHTTEFNFTSESKTLESEHEVLFLKKHFVDLGSRLAAAGHRVSALNFDIGNGFFDRFVDVPPYELGPEWGNGSDWAHLKLNQGGFACTCFGLIVEKPGSAP